MKKITLVEAADSLGVPYSRDNIEHQGFFELIEKRLGVSFEVTSFNCFHMAINNDNNYISDLLRNESSLSEIKDGQNKMLKKCKYSGLYPFLEMPKRFLNHYKILEGDEKTFLLKSIKNNKTIFIYSAFVNDLLKAKKLSLFKLLRPGRIKYELENIAIDFVLDKLENNIEYLIQLNRDIEIYIIGLFVPTKIFYIRKNLRDFIKRVNESLKEVCSKYDHVIFVNNDNLNKEDFNNIDFHPNRKGHKKIYENFVQAYENSVDKK